MSLSNQAILQSINADRALASAMLFPHRHRQETPAFHIQIMDMWRSADPRVVIKAFREGAKTTLSEEFLLLEAAFGNFKYGLVVGETWTKACQRIEAIKHEIATNRALFTLFGNMKDTVWSADRVILKNGTLLEAHGWEEEFRGFKHRDMRPDRAYLDDIENKEMVRDKATVDANWKKLHLQLIPAMDKEFGKIRMTGTPLGEDCMIERAAASADWTSGVFPICDRSIDDPDAQSAWPGRYPMQWIRQTRDHFEREGMLREFNQEFMLIAAGSHGKPFTEEMLHYTGAAPLGFHPKTVIVDPARTVEVKTSDRSGSVVVSKVGTRFYIHESAGEYWQPDELVKAAYALARKHDDARVVIEKNSLDNWLLQPIRAYGLMTGQALDLTPVNAPQDRDKTQFIMGLASFFHAGDIVFVGDRAKHNKLVSEILNFPTGKRDILNALAYILRVYNGVAVYGDFGSENICEGGSPERSDVLLLGCNASGSETTAVLVASSGRKLTVLADWVSPLMPNDSIPDIAMLIRSVYPGRKITAWVPADVFDRVGRNPLIAALTAAKLTPNRGENTAMARGSLSPLIRTTMGGRRMLLVDANARHMMTALAERYNFPVKSGGERHTEPERGPARILVEGLETLVAAVEQAQGSVGYQTNAVNSLGTAYISALPSRR